MQQNRDFYLGVEESDGTIKRICNINEIKDMELTVEATEVERLFSNAEFTFEIHDNFNIIGRIFCVLNNVRKFKGMPMHRKRAFKKAHKIAKRMQQDKLIAVDLANEP